jgi:hypothetical protein
LLPLLEDSDRDAVPSWLECECEDGKGDGDIDTVLNDEDVEAVPRGGAEALL